MGTKTNMNFAQEVISHLKSSGDGEWLLLEPHLLYLDEAQAQSYLAAMKNEDYRIGFHSESVSLIENHIDHMLREVRSLQLIDLGPGFPDKSLPIAKWCNKNNVSFDYYPVDISETYLHIAGKAMTSLAQKVTPIHSRFEDLPKNKLVPKGSDVVIMLGLTFMNFESSYILDLLNEISPKSRKIIAAELLDPKDINSILDRYRIPETEALAKGPLRLVGIHQDDLEYNVDFNKGRIELSVQVQKIPTDLHKIGMQSGDRVITAISHRYTLEEFEHTVRTYFKNCDLYCSAKNKTVLGVCS